VWLADESPLSDWGDELARRSRWTLSYAALACTVRLFAALSLQQEMGVLFLSVLFMTRDVTRLLALLGLAAIGFGLTMAGVVNSSALAATSPWTPFLAPFWQIHGQVRAVSSPAQAHPRRHAPNAHALICTCDHAPPRLPFRFICLT